MIKEIPKLSIDDIIRFENKIIRYESVDVCWPWVSDLNNYGYGYFRINYTMYMAHRIAYFLFYKIQPILLVCHHCDNPPCCNPHHLFQGTHSDNAKDYYEKELSKHIISSDKRKRIQKYWENENTSYQVVANFFDISHQSVSNIVNERN